MKWRIENKKRNRHIKSLKKMRKETPKGKYKNFFTYDSLGHSDWADIYFVGNFNGKNVLYNATIQTLKLEAEDEISNMVNDILDRIYPKRHNNLNKIQDIENSSDFFSNIWKDEKLANEIWEKEREIQAKIEKEGIFVQPYVEVLMDYQFGKGLTIVTDCDVITPEEIDKSISLISTMNLKDYNKNYYGTARKISVSEIKTVCSTVPLIKI